MNVPRLLVTTSTLPRWGGDSDPRFVLDLSRHLLGRFDVTILAPLYPGANRHADVDGVEVVRYAYAPLRALETIANPGSIVGRLKENPALWCLVPGLFAGLYRAIHRQLALRQYDLIHAHWFAPQGLVHAAAARRGYPPFVVTSHGGDMMLASRRLFRSAFRSVLHRAAGVTVVSSHLLGELSRIDPAYDVRGVAVIPMGADLFQFSPVKRNPEWDQQLGLARPIILAVGRLVEKKGFEYLLDALAQAPLNQTSASVVIAGDGPSRRALERRVEELQLRRRVRFLGSKSHSELQTIFASSDIFCAPSVVGADGDTDGLPTVLCEAAASGLPLVATNVGGISQLVVPGATGSLVPQRNSEALARELTALASDEESRKALGKGAACYVQQFSWQEIARRYGDVLEAAEAGFRPMPRPG